MIYSQFRRLALAGAALSCLAGSQTLVAADADVAPQAPYTVTYTATGVFASPPISGNDLFELAGQPFTISVYLSSAATPSSHGSAWAQYNNLKMSGTLNSGIEPGMPQQIFCPQPNLCPAANIFLATGNSKYELFELFAVVTVVGLPINIQANLHIPLGTISLAHPAPFAPVEIGAPDTVTYSSATFGTSTTLGIASGSLIGTFPGGGSGVKE